MSLFNSVPLFLRVYFFELQIFSKTGRYLSSVSFQIFKTQIWIIFYSLLTEKPIPMKTLIIITLVTSSFISHSQILPGDDILNKRNVIERKVTPYPSLREADLMWSKRIWRYIDLQEKINLPLKYPKSNTSNDRISLMDVFADAIRNGKLSAYGYEDDEFTAPITWEKIEIRGGARIDTVEMADENPPYNPIWVPVKKTFSPDKVIGYLIKEDWFFDKQRSVMEARIIGIAPLMYAIDETGNIREGNYKIPLFWIYYPEARQLLTNHDVFVRDNNNPRISYDDLFQKRFFGSYIIKESNVYDRRIDEYKQGISALLESDRIKQDITNFEHDMWEF
jgi:gliding motility associated protien GldN